MNTSIKSGHGSEQHKSKATDCNGLFMVKFHKDIFSPVLIGQQVFPFEAGSNQQLHTH